jgi:hypothetical protein
LKLQGEEGKWEFTQLGSKTVLMSVDAEIKDLETQIRDEERLKQRIVEVNQLLGVKVNATKK